MRDRPLKDSVREYWNKTSCGEVYSEGSTEMDRYESQRQARYRLEPYLVEFAKFESAMGKDVLEIGVGMGADHIEFARAMPRTLAGVDLTPRAIDHTTRRAEIYGIKSDLIVADAENLPFDDNSFDLVYSWGVIHHSPDTQSAVNEIHRVLRFGGQARVMIYHRYSMVGLMLWARYGLLKGRPWLTLDEIYSSYLESPGTKAYSISEAHSMFRKFTKVEMRTQLTFGDLLEGEVGQRHHSLALSFAKMAWPRGLIRAYGRRFGLDLCISAIK
jgi:ubiquinone/menaquinone biosynthesis C-methylase UbiE